MPRRAAVAPAWLCIVAPLLALSVSPRSLAAQDWDSPQALALVGRAIARRQAELADTALRDFTARAHGFVFFLGQIGEGLSEPPKLIKADQLELQVYWKAPNLSKQIIIGWRDKMDLPTDIQYHRDHLGIALNNFPDRIRIGDGDEVRDIPHPLAPNGPSLYQYALTDSLSIQLPDRAIRVYEIAVRPRDFRAPRLVGSLFIDVDLSDLVRMSFEFTRSAYLDQELEDITVSIENSLWEGRWWLPYHQELAIRRRGTWLDFPVRGIIQGHWDIDTYRFNQGVDPDLFMVPGSIIAAAPETRAAYPWRDSLEAEIRDVAQSPRLEDFAAVRAKVQEVAMGHAIDGLRRAQLGGASLSDFAHFNRVEGLALGLGGTLRGGDDAVQLRVKGGAATATALFTGGADFTAREGAWTWRLSGARAVRDLGDDPVISGVVNSLSAQETGADFGDYFLATTARGGATLTLGSRTALDLAAGWERVGSLATHATWARGSFSRANPPVGSGDWAQVHLALRRDAPAFTDVTNLSGRLELEGGDGTSAYLRGFGEVLGGAGVERLARHPGERRSGHAGPARLPRLRAGRAGHAAGRGVPGLRRPRGGLGIPRAAAPRRRAGSAPGLLRGHRHDPDPDPLRGGWVGRRPGDSGARRRLPRGPPGGRPRPRLVPRPGALRRRLRPQDRQARGRDRRQPGLLGHPVKHSAGPRCPPTGRGAIFSGVKRSEGRRERG